VLARLFSREEAVIDTIVLYLCVVPIGYGMTGLAIVTGSGMNGINHPLHAAALGAIRTLGLTIPLAALGGRCFGLKGIFAAIATANVLGGVVAILWIRRLHHAAIPKQADE
jgi:Na+-driven multidrug efflux pump